METKSKALGNKIKLYRQLNSIRQEDLAEVMGVSRATLINYEKGYTTINLDALNRLKNYYPNIDLDIKSEEKPRIIVDNSIDFLALFNILNKARRYIVFNALIFSIIGLGMSFMFTKYYTAQITLYPAKKELTQNLGQFQSLAANFGMNTPNSDQSFNIPDVVKSRLIANKAVKEDWALKDGSMIDLKSLWYLKRKGWGSLNTSGLRDSVIIVEKAIKKFYDHVKVSEDRISGLIKISTTFQDPNLAASIANFIGNQVENYIQKENSAQSTKEKLFISDRSIIVKNELQESERELKDFKERNRGYEDSPELFMIYSQL